MKKIFLKFADKILSKEDVKDVKGGFYGGAWACGANATRPTGNVFGHSYVDINTAIKNACGGGDYTFWYTRTC